jgi:Spy/CpxP family protein refolding chaperone
MKTLKYLMILTAAAVSVGGLSMAHARAQEAGPQRMLHGHFLEKTREKLGLSDEQVTKIKAELSADKDKLTGLMTSLHDARVGLRETIQKSGASEGDVRAAAAKVAAVEADLAVERAKLYGRISPILTPEQLTKVKEFQERVDDFADTAIKTFGERLAQ